MERLIDTAAAEMGIDRLELRRRNHIAPRRDALQGAVGHRPMTAAISRACSTRRSQAADWNGFAARKAAERARGKLRGRGIGQLSRSHGAAGQGDGRHPLRGRRRRHHRHRHARLRPGPCHALRAGAGAAGSAFRSSASACCRATATSCIVRRRHRRLALDHGERHGARRGQRQGDRARQADRRRMCSKPRPPISNSRKARFTIVGTDRSIGIMELAERLRGGAEPAGRRCRSRSTSRSSPTRRPRPFPTAATSPRSRSIPTPAWSRSSKYSMVNDFGMIVNPLLVEGQAHGGVVQGIGQALMERTRLRRATASSSPAPTWTTRCRAPTTRRCSRSSSHPVPARPIRSASRAAARRAAPARCRR